MGSQFSTKQIKFNLQKLPQLKNNKAIREHLKYLKYQLKKFKHFYAGPPELLREDLVELLSGIDQTFVQQITFQDWSYKLTKKLNDNEQYKFKGIKILKSMQSIKFNGLKKLYLGQSSITSIQSLALLDCPQLQVLSIRHTSITKLKPFSKLKLKNLKRLDFEWNYLIPPSQIEYFCRCLFSVEMQRLSLQIHQIYGWYSFGQVTFIDFGRFLKTNWKQLSKISFNQKMCFSRQIEDKVLNLDVMGKKYSALSEMIYKYMMRKIKGIPFEQFQDYI